jgi:hypothetical protein
VSVPLRVEIRLAQARCPLQIFIKPYKDGHGRRGKVDAVFSFEGLKE